MSLGKFQQMIRERKKRRCRGRELYNEVREKGTILFFISERTHRP